MKNTFSISTSHKAHIYNYNKHTITWNFKEIIEYRVFQLCAPIILSLKACNANMLNKIIMKSTWKIIAKYNAK